MDFELHTSAGTWRAPQSVGQSGHLLRFSVRFQTGIPLLELGAESPVKRAGPSLEHEVGTLF